MELGFSKVDAVDWLIDLRWIVFGYDGGFGQYLEHCYFAPGTPKNAEFEVLVAPMAVNGVFGIGAFYRIKDTVENREALRAAIAEFYEKHLLSLAEIDRLIENLRGQIRERVLPRLR
jgi:hypothetical protein